MSAAWNSMRSVSKNSRSRTRRVAPSGVSENSASRIARLCSAGAPGSTPKPDATARWLKNANVANSTLRTATGRRSAS
jgi:hypothetical protein